MDPEITDFEHSAILITVLQRLSTMPALKDLKGLKPDFNLSPRVLEFDPSTRKFKAHYENSKGRRPS